MKHFFLLVLGALSIFCSAQQAQECSPTEFQKLKSDYDKMTKSENYVSMRATSKELAKKLNQIKGWEDFKFDNTWDRWITENISKTKFSSIEEAHHLRNQMLALTRKNQEEYREMWIRFKLASRQQRLDLWLPNTKVNLNRQFRYIILIFLQSPNPTGLSYSN